MSVTCRVTQNEHGRSTMALWSHMVHSRYLRCMLAKTEFVAKFYVYVYMMLASDSVYDYMCLFTFPSGADLDRLNNKQLTPSHLAVSMGRLEAIRLLIQLGANVDKPGK